MCHYALAKRDIAAFCACKLHSNITAILLQCWTCEWSLCATEGGLLMTYGMCAGLGWPGHSQLYPQTFINQWFFFFLNFICFLPRRDQSNWVLWLFLGSVNATEAWLYDQSDRRCAKTENPPHFIVRQLEFNLSYHYLEWSRKKRGTILRRVLKQALRPSASCLPYCSSSPQTAHCTFSPARN